MRPTPLRDAIRACLAGQGEMGTAEIARRMGTGTENVCNTLRPMRKRGEVVSPRRGFWRLAGDEDSEAAPAWQAPPEDVPVTTLEQALAVIERGLRSAEEGIINPYTTSLQLAAVHLNRALELRVVS